MFLSLMPRRRLLGDAKLLGRWGEKRCEKFLKRKGFKVVARNYSCRAGEIDLVMEDSDGTIVFVEVKSRSAEDFARAQDSVTISKRRKMARAAKNFAATYKIRNRPMRFDVVAVVVGKDGPAEVRHYRDAFVM